MLDSPYFRENLKAHEKQLDQTSQDMKGIIHDIQQVIEAAKALTKAKKTLAETLGSFQFDCLGTSLTDDEIIISSSLKQFSSLLCSLEDEMENMLSDASEKFITPLVAFRKHQIGSVKQTKKSFDKQTAKFCAIQEKYVNMSSKKEENLAEAAENYRYELKNLNASSLEYVYLLQVMQERKKFEFVEPIYEFTKFLVDHYRHGNRVASDFSGYMDDLNNRVHKTRDNFTGTVDQYKALKETLLSSSNDPGLLNKMYTRQGYLFLQSKKNMKLGTVWSKFYCQYQSKTKTLTMIPYSQLHGKITSTESLRVTGCVCNDEASDKFRFSVTGEDLSCESSVIVTHHIQALSEYERKNWVEALGGTWPAVNTLQRIRADSVEENLNSSAFIFLKDCLSELEARGLSDQGLYRVGGVITKVKKLLSLGLDPQECDAPLELSDPRQWESKTIAGCVKQYFRDLSKPLMTHRLYNDFIEASKHKDEEERIREICLLLRKLPVASREMLKVLMRHLKKVSLRSEKNLMTASNLSVCFGPTLLWPKEKTVASIMDIKFCNEVVEILIENCDRMFPAVDSSPEFLLSRKMRTSTDSPSPVAFKTPPKVRRSQSFSLFSELSTSSLPEIKEFNSEKLDRPRSKSHQHEIPPRIPPRAPPNQNSPVTLGQMSTSEQDELMASLEMMTSLAADLPSTTMHRQWSYTLQNRRNRRTPTREVTRKPPLPKLSILPLSPSTPPPTPTGQLHFPPSNQNPRNQSFLRYNSSPTSMTPEPAFKRPADFPTKLVSTMDRLHTVPRQNKRASDRNLVIEERRSGDPPPIPLRKYKNILKDQQNNGTPNNASTETACQPNHLSDNLSPTHETEFRLNTSTPLKIQTKPNSNSQGINLSVDSGVLSPSPPCAMSHLNKGERQKHDQAEASQSEDGLSLLSCSLSETSDLSESKYDNVHFHMNNNEEDEHPLKDKKLDEFEGSDCSSILGNLVLGSSESDIGNCECSERSQLCNRQKNDYNNHTKYLDNRDSGPYENVQEAPSTSGQSQLGGINSLRNILGQGKTTNV